MPYDILLFTEQANCEESRNDYESTTEIRDKNKAAFLNNRTITIYLDFSKAFGK